MAKSLPQIEEDPEELLSFDDKLIMVVGAMLLAVVTLIVGYVVIGGYLANQIFANLSIPSI